MTLSVPGIFGALLFLFAGLIVLAAFNRSVYPVLSERHERLKVTQEHGGGPGFLAKVVRIQSLVIMPIVGYILGQMLFSSVGAS